MKQPAFSIFLLFLLTVPAGIIPVCGQQQASPPPLRVGFHIDVMKITPDKMQYCRSEGIDCIELSGIIGFINKADRTLKYSNEEMTNIVHNVKKAADEAGIEIWSIHMPYAANIDLSLISEPERKAVVAMHRQLLHYFRILQPKIILFHPSYYLGLNEREARKKQFYKSARELNRQVLAIRSTMVIENMLGPELLADANRERPLCRSVEETVEIMNRLPDNIYSAVDMNHIKNPEKLILAMGRRLKSLHVADGDGQKERHYFPCSGQGQNNWTAILLALHEVKYSGPFMLESAYKDIKDIKTCYDSLYHRFVQELHVQTSPGQSRPSTTENIFVDSILTAKNFPLLVQFQQHAGIRRLLSGHTYFKKMAVARQAQWRRAVTACSDAACLVAPLQWSASEIQAAGNALVGLYRNKKKLRNVVTRMKAAGHYYGFHHLADTAWLRKAWTNAAWGMNHVFNIYLEGKAPRYAKIDAGNFSPSDTGLIRRLKRKMLSEANGPAQMLFFEPSLHTALFALQVNGRDEAARYEPLGSGMNSAPLAAVDNADWNEYPYSVILVPGKGPDSPGIKLDPAGVQRCQDAVQRFRDKQAPFLVVSGGHVHPNKTPDCEAVEMKKYLVEQCGIPDSVIFIEPHARHTTTNLRNVSRLIFRFGIPANKPVLIVTDESQNNYIVQRMGKTALRDLGYEPFRDLRQLSAKESMFFPVKNCLQPDPFDPLDP